MPTKAEKPLPNRLSASPAAYWLVFSQITSRPKAPASSAPAPMPAAKASQSLPVCTAVAKPAMAATSISPSAPRLTMPARSLISRPSAARASRVAAFIEAAVRSAIASISNRPPPRRGAAQAVMDEGVASQQAEQQQALEPPGDGLGQAQARLRQLAADIEHAHQDPREHDANRVQAPDEGHDDGREAIAGRYIGRQLAQRPGRFQRGGPPAPGAPPSPARPPESSSAVHSARVDEKPA